MDGTALLTIALLVLGFGLVSRRLDGSVITPPMVFVAAGLAAGPHALGLIEVADAEHQLHRLAELTLILVLFADASRIDLRALRREVGLPVRLLLVGLPLTIVVGALVGKLMFPSLGWLEAGVLGAVLAPTDAALGQAVVASPAVPLRIRQALNVESGLNDGVALPVVMVLAALASIGSGAGRTPTEWATFAALQVTVGPLAGVAVGFFGARAISAARRRAWMTPTFIRLSGLALALLAYAGSEALGGNGFIAAFVAGMTLGHVAPDHGAGLHDFLEAEGQLLILLVFLLLGAALAWPAVAASGGAAIGYALLSLTAVRMLPVALSLVGAGLRWPTIGFLGWFGPRGLASALFAILIITDSALPHGELIFHVTLLTVLLSVGAHGLTAAPFARWYGGLSDDAARCPAEHEAVFAHPLRRRAEVEADDS